MRLIGLRLHHVELPLVSPFTTSFSTQTAKRCFLVEATLRTREGDVVTGWGENVALDSPYYSPEYLRGSADVIEHWIAPLLFAVENLTAETVAHHLHRVIGHPMSKASVEMAVLDAQLRVAGISFAEYLGVTRTSVPSGVSVGIHDTIEATVAAVGGYIDEGYARIKLKIKPGRDVNEVAAVRAAFGDDLPFQVDANAAYTLADTARLRRLDDYGLLLLEQPLGEADLRQHSELAKQLSTPICLDESVISAESAADAITLGAAAVINIKPGRVGGYLEARRIHDLARAHGIAVWCGGMLETSLGRAANAALAALPGFTLTGDVSGSDRFYRDDLTTQPILMHDGVVDVPTGPGFGVEIDPDALRRFTTEVTEIVA